MTEINSFKNFNTGYLFGSLTGNTASCDSFGVRLSLPPIFDFNPVCNFGISPFMNYNPSYNLPIFSLTQPNFNLPDLNSSIASCSNNNLADNYSYNIPKLELPEATVPHFDYKYSPAENFICDSFTKSSNNTLQQKLVQNALSYSGKVNSDREGNRLFSGGARRAWCADFVTHVTKDTYGSKLPSNFGSSSVYGLRYWAQKNNCYTATETKSLSAKKEFIAQNVKPGDIMVEKRGGKSHTGIVTNVYSDGSFDTVEGNASNRVKTNHYTANSRTLSGFINLDRYSA